VADLLEHCLAHVQQPDRQPLPLLAEELGRQVPGPSPRRLSRPWIAAATVVLAAVLGGILLSALPRSTNTHATAEVADNNPAAAEASIFNDGSRELTAIQSSVDAVRQSLYASPDYQGGHQTAISAVRQRTETLRRDFDASEPVLDSVESQLSAIRCRIDRLRHDLAPYAD
jgi:hypothetical protein